MRSSSDRASDLQALAVVVMGVSGCGKSTIGERLARDLGLPFLDADSFHPPRNVEKMRAGQPLTDEDRWPWLDAVGDHARVASAGYGVVVACSALRRAYRERLRARIGPQLLFVHLHGDRELLASRLEARLGHFMPAALLHSQIATLERLSTEEGGLEVDIDSEPGPLVASIARRVLASRSASGIPERIRVTRRE